MQTSSVKAASLRGYEDVVRMYERGWAYSRELDERGCFQHLPRQPPRPRQQSTVGIREGSEHSLWVSR